MISQDVLEARIEELKPEHTYKDAVFFDQFAAEGVKSHTSHGVTLFGHSLEGKSVLIHPLGIRDSHKDFETVKNLFELYQRESFAILPKLYYAGNSQNHGYSIVFEAPQGKQLSAILQKGALPHEKSFSILSAICIGLMPIHQAGVAHGNITAKSVYLKEDGTVTLAEPFENHIYAYRKEKKAFNPFQCGTFRIVDFSTESPYRAMGKPPSVAEDIFSLGGLLLEMLLGSQKLRKLTDTRSENVGSVVEEYILKPMKLSKSVPLGYGNWIASCVEREKSDCFATLETCYAALRAAELSRELDPVFR